MLLRVKLAAFAIVLLTLPLAGCHDSKKTSAVQAATTTQAAAPPPARLDTARRALQQLSMRSQRIWLCRV